jgi:hypothetical protein
MTNNFYMGKMLGDIISSQHNQHCLMAIIGRTGSGKSSAAIQIAHETAKYMATFNSHPPEYYFNIDHMAIISEDEIIRVMSGIKKQGIYILDDIGVGWNSRKWQSKANIVMNNIIQTFRTWNNLLILTVPDDENIDKVPRNSLRYRIDMKDANFDMGYSLGAMQELSRNYKTKKNFFPYPKEKGVKYVRVKFVRPPPFLIDEYELRRAAIQAKMQEDNIAQMKEVFNEQNDIDNSEPFYKSHSDEIYERVEFSNEKKIDLSLEFDVSLPTINSAFKHGAKKYKNQHKQQ